MMIATAVPMRRREVLAIDMCTVSRLPMPFVNPQAQLIDWPVLGAGNSVPFCQLSPQALSDAGIEKGTNGAIHKTGHDHHLFASKTPNSRLHHGV